MEQLEIIKNIQQLPSVRTQPKENIMLGLLAIVKTCFDLVNQKVIPENINLIAAELTAEIIEKYKSYTFVELVRALKKGTKGEYGEYYGLNVKTFCDFLRAYSKSDDREAIIKEKLNNANKLLTPMTELTESEKTEIVRLGCLEKFEVFKAKKYVNDMGNIAFDYLVKTGKIIFTNEKAVDYLRAAEKEIKLDAAIKLTGTADIFLRNLYKDKFDDPRKNCLAEIKALAKNMALNDWFAELVSIDAELNDLIGN